MVFDNIEPDIPAKERMLENVLYHSKNRKINTMFYFNFRKAVPALVLTVVLAGGILSYGLKDIIFNNGMRGSSPTEIAQDGLIDNDTASGREDMVAPLLNQFQIKGRNYILMSDYVEEFGFNAAISDGDIGNKIATIEKSPDKSLIGCEVFEYIPAGCQAVVVVKRNNAYELYRFFTFESYNNNQDEDAIEYLKLYGINSPEDIAKIQFIVHTERSKLEGTTNITGEITDRNEIARFYSFYSVLRNSSDKYFEKLFGSRPGSRDVEIDRVNPDGQKGEIVPDEKSVEPVVPDYMPAPDYDGTSGSSSSYPGIAEDMPLSAGEGRDAVIAIEPYIAIDQPADLPVIGGDTPVSVIIDRGNVSSPTGGSSSMTGFGSTEPVTVAPAQGGSVGNDLDDPVTIKIYNKKGVYLETTYYKNIGFISRYEISSDFAAFIENYIK